VPYNVVYKHLHVFVAVEIPLMRPMLGVTLFDIRQQVEPISQMFLSSVIADADAV